MPCAAAASSRIQASVRPAIGMPWKALRDGEDFFEGERHRPPTCAAGEYKRTVDVEKDECGGARPNSSPRTLPARGPLADGSSSKLTRWPSFSESKLPWTELRWKNHSCPPSSRMKPKPRSRTSRLMVPLDIRVSLGTDTCPRASEYQVSFQLSSQRFLAALRPSREARPRQTAKTNTYRCTRMRLFHRHRDHLAGARQGVVQVVAKLQRELVLPGRQLHVELVLAVAEVHPRRRALDDVLAGREAVLIRCRRGSAPCPGRVSLSRPAAPGKFRFPTSRTSCAPGWSRSRRSSAR